MSVRDNASALIPSLRGGRSLTRGRRQVPAEVDGDTRGGGVFRVVPVFTKERNDWKGLKPTKPKKYPEELYEFHPTGELNNPVSKIIRKSTTRNISKTNLNLIVKHY